MTREIPIFPGIFDVDVDVSENPTTSVIPRFVRDFRGYAKAKEAPSDLELFDIQSGRNCHYQKTMDRLERDIKNRQIRCLRYQKVEQSNSH